MSDPTNRSQKSLGRKLREADGAFRAQRLHDDVLKYLVCSYKWMDGWIYYNFWSKELKNCSQSVRMQNIRHTFHGFTQVTSVYPAFRVNNWKASKTPCNPSHAVTQADGHGVRYVSGELPKRAALCWRDVEKPSHSHSYEILTPSGSSRVNMNPGCANTHTQPVSGRVRAGRWQAAATFKDGTEFSLRTVNCSLIKTLSGGLYSL